MIVPHEAGHRPATLNIRPCLPQDAPGVAALIVPIQQLEYGIAVTLGEQPDLADIAGFYQQRDGNFWVAEVEGRIVGTIGLLDIGSREAALRKMFVAEAFRGSAHGVARALLDTLMAWSLARGITTIYLGTTEKFVAAHRFYEKHGFVEIHRDELPAAFPVMKVDSKFYRRTQGNWASFAPMFNSRAEVESFIGEFEARRLPKARWTHQAHLVAGFWYISRLTSAEALGTMRQRIRAHNDAVGTPNTDSSGYHETITRLYLKGIAAHIAAHQALPIERSLAALLVSPVAKKEWPLTYYSSQLLFSTKARREWVEPDLQPFH